MPGLDLLNEQKSIFKQHPNLYKGNLYAGWETKLQRLPEVLHKSSRKSFAQVGKPLQGWRRDACHSGMMFRIGDGCFKGF